MELAKILVVDDEPDIVELTATYLEAEGFDVAKAYCCQEADQAINAGGIQVVVSDFRMPDGTGVDLMRSVRSNRDANMPFVFYSAYADALQRGGAAGASRCEVLQKPASRREIVAAVKRAVAMISAA